MNSEPTNGGTVSGGGTYELGSNCTLNAVAAVGYEFVNWTLNGSYGWSRFVIAR
ncbi:MAG: hypothetical protein IJQ11_10210 [Bacteroidales bacterium]|nr:hypothetical protein [Bacteroidales bacterium]